MRLDNFKRYTFNTDGTVVSNNGRVLKTHLCKKGYHRVNLKDDSGRKRTHLVHRLIAKAHIPNPDGKPQVNHIDGNKSNNAVHNLEWCTNLENNHHAVLLGLHKQGSERPNSKLSDDQVRAMRLARLEGLNYYQLGRMFNVAYQTAHKVCTGQIYKRV